jgi:hypothetical protein
MSTEEQRQARLTELMSMLDTGDGRFELLDLFQRTGIGLALEADLRTELIPAILTSEYPDLPPLPPFEPESSVDVDVADMLRRANPR